MENAEAQSEIKTTKPGKRFYGAVGLIALLCILLVIGAALTPPVWQLEKGPVEVTRWPKKGETVYKIGPGEKHWVSIKSVSRHVLNAIVVSEDARFYDHFGLDFVEIEKSIAKNLKAGRYVRGASTITQQVVKMAFLSSNKTLLRKTQEALGALLAEQLLTKDQILEWYINLAEFGDGVFGIKAASEHYFATKPELLTIQYGANLALVLPSPNSWSKGLRDKQLTDFGHKRYAQIINRMLQNGMITETLWLNALATGDFGRPVKAYYKIMTARSDAERKAVINADVNDEDEPAVDEDMDDQSAQTDVTTRQ